MFHNSTEYNISERKVLLIPDSDKRSLNSAEQALKKLDKGLTGLGFKTRDRIGGGYVGFSIAELRKAIKICEIASKREVIFCD